MAGNTPTAVLADRATAGPVSVPDGAASQATSAVTTVPAAVDFQFICQFNCTTRSF
jgi:hypothetical protein